MSSDLRSAVRDALVDPVDPVGQTRTGIRVLRAVAVGLIGVGLAFALTVGYGRVFAEPAGLQVEGEERDFIQLVNDVRASASCPPVSADPALMRTAQAHAQDMVARGYLSSVTPDNLDPVGQAHRFGYTGAVTESYAAGLAVPAEVVGQWTNPGNPLATQVKQRIQDCRMVSIGVGHDTGTVLPGLAAQVWVMTLGDR